jgi:hypothetical protein
MSKLLEQYIKQTSKSFKADDIFIEIVVKDKDKLKITYVNIKDKKTNKQIYFETTEAFFTPFGCSNSVQYPDSYSIVASFNKDNEHDMNFFSELKKLEGMILDKISEESKTLLKKKMTKEEILLKEKFSSKVQINNVEKSDGTKTTYHQINLKVSSDKLENKPITILFSEDDTSKPKYNYDTDKEKLTKAESWDLIKKYIPRQTKVRAIFVPKVNVMSSNISFSFSVQQILVPKYEEKENTVFGFSGVAPSKPSTSAASAAASLSKVSGEDTEEEEVEEEEEEDDDEDD